MLSKQRIGWVDVTKGIGILCILLGHAPNARPVITYLYSFHIPLFFFLAGLVSPPDKFSLRAKVRSILVPYLAFCLIECVVYVAYIKNWYHLQFPLTDVIAGFAYGSVFQMVFGSILWFLPCLFVTALLAQCMWKFAGRRAPLWAVASSLIIYGSISFRVAPTENLVLIPNLPFGADSAMMAVLFFVSGQVAAKYQSSIERLSVPKAVGVFVVAVTASLILNSMDVETDLAHRAFGTNYLLYVSCASAGILGSIMLGRIFSGSRLLKLIGRNTMVIFAFHKDAFDLLNILGAFYNRSGFPKFVIASDFRTAVIYTAFGMALTSCLAWLINRYAPFMSGRTRKLRIATENHQSDNCSAVPNG